MTDSELYQALEQSWVSLFLIERKTPEGLVVRDLADANRSVCHLVDIGLIHSARPGMALVGRLLPAPRFAMLSGWGFAAQPEQVDHVLREVHRIAQTESRRARPGTTPGVSLILRGCPS